MPLHHHSGSVVGGLSLVDNVIHVQLHPWRSEHVVHEAVLSIAPVSWQLLELEANYFIICIQHCIHIGVKTLQCIHCLQVKLYFKLIIWVSTYDKVNIIPVGEKKFL